MNWASVYTFLAAVSAAIMTACLIASLSEDEPSLKVATALLISLAATILFGMLAVGLS